MGGEQHTGSSSGHGRRGGRKARVALDQVPEQEINPCPSGQRGSYALLSRSYVDAIYRTALRITCFG